MVPAPSLLEKEDVKSLILASAIAFAAASTAGADANLIINGNFDTDVVPWVKVNDNFAIVWDPADSAGLQDSGSARVTSSQVDQGGTMNGGAGAQECIEVVPSANYAVSAAYFIPSGQDRTAEPDIGIAWFLDSQCLTTALPPEQSLIPQGESTTDMWLPLGGDVVAPDDSHSANVILRPRKLEAGGSVDVLFDAVAFVPEPGAAALGASAVAALAIRRRLLTCITS